MKEWLLNSKDKEIEPKNNNIYMYAIILKSKTGPNSTSIAERIYMHVYVYNVLYCTPTRDDTKEL